MKPLFLLLTLLINTTAYALNTDNTQLATNASCTPEKIINNLFTKTIQKQAEISVNSSSALKEISKISKNAKNPEKSIGEQLSVEENDAFSENAQHINTMNMVLIIESNYERDLIAVERLIKIVDDYYYYGKTPDTKGPDAFYIQLLLAWRGIMNKEINMEPNISNQCTLDTALYNKEIIHLKEFSKSSKELFSSYNKFKQIMNKYNMKTFDYDKLNANDKHEVLMLNEKVILPLEKERFYVIDIMNIRHFAKISKLIYDSSLKDLLNSGGNSDLVGNTINKLFKAHQLNGEDKKMFSSWQILDEKIPSYFVKNFKLLAKTLNEKNNHK